MLLCAVEADMRRVIGQLLTREAFVSSPSVPPQDADDNLVINISDGFINRRNWPFARDLAHDISAISLFRAVLSVARQERVRERRF